MTTVLKISGMTCQNCARHVREALEKVPNVSSVHVDLTAGQAVVNGPVSELQLLIKAVENAGYTAAQAG